MRSVKREEAWGRSMDYRSLLSGLLDPRKTHESQRIVVAAAGPVGKVVRLYWEIEPRLAPRWPFSGCGG